MSSRVFFIAGALLAALAARAEPIDRHALVSRHDPTITAIDASSPFMVGNGSLGFTADITGLQTFQEQYSALVPLMTQASWSWHSFPGNFPLERALVPVDVRGRKQLYPWIQDWEQAKKPDIQWLRENPHRFSLGRLALHLVTAGGKAAAFVDLSNTKQTLDLWNGRLLSSFTFDGAPVEVETSVHATRDIVVVRLKSPLLFDGRLGVDLRFPGVNAQLNPDPADWAHPATHTTTEIARGPDGLSLARQLDATQYSVKVAADRELDIQEPGAHAYRFAAPGSMELTLLVEFSPAPTAPLPNPQTARLEAAQGWQGYWSQGAALDLSGTADPRATELERRVVLSQYLAAINQAGSVPPQEEGLFSNSWNGKFHLEMHAWHAAHFAAWGRPALLERSLGWYAQHLAEAQARARSHGVRGAWWPKMVGPEGRESPSTVNPFIMWQQPHPIYLAELVYAARRDRATLEKYRDVVFATADLLASWPHLDAKTRRYSLGPPVIPAQENHPPLTTFNPTFEIEYFRFGLSTAQAWRERLGLKRNARWDDVLQRLAPLPVKDGLYLAAESQQDLWTRSAAPECTPPRTADACPNRDHPSLVATLGYLPGAGADRETMRRTLDAVMAHWDLRQTWGWDWPMLAMTAARLGEADRAIDFLVTKDARNFAFGISGMTPRVHLDADAAPHAVGAADAPGYRRAAETYFPSNGALLLAVALLAGGDTGPDGKPSGPLFPREWHVRTEGFVPLP